MKASKIVTVMQPQEELPVTHTCDVLVVGGGIAGVSAALAAAREGSDVLLVEREWALGGLATLGLISIYLPLCDGEGRQVVFGIGEELFRLAVKHGAEENTLPVPWLTDGDEAERRRVRYQAQYNPNLLMLEAENLLLTSGVRLLYGTLVSDVQTSDGMITSVVAQNKGGRFAICPRTVVDATGDADICYMSGAKTAVFKAGNPLACWHYANTHGKRHLQTLGAADVPDRDKQTTQEKPLSARRFSGLNGDDLTDMVTLAHGQLLRRLDGYLKADPGYEVTEIPTIPQIRMTRRLCGEYTLSEAEQHTPFADSIGMTGDWRKPGPVYELPFGTLYTHLVRNLTVAGRCISVADDMWDITRVIPTCAVTGQAAGLAAAIAEDMTTLDVAQLQRKLESAGVVLHEW